MNYCPPQQASPCNNDMDTFHIHPSHAFHTRSYMQNLYTYIRIILCSYLCIYIVACRYWQYLTKLLLPQKKVYTPDEIC